MALGGLNGFAARLPFAILGLLCLPLTYLFARRAFGSQTVARLSALLLGLSVPFLVHCRQARWYALAYLLVICLLLAFFELDRHPQAAPAAVALSSLLLFYTNYFIALGLLASVCAAAPILRPGRPFWKRLAVALAAASAGALPGMIFFHILGKAGTFSPEHAAGFFTAYVGLFFTQLFPMPLLALLLWVLSREESGASVEPAARRRAFFLLACLGLYIGYLSLGPWIMFRYLTVLLPPCAVLAAVALDGLRREKRALAAAALALLIGTDVLHAFPLRLGEAPGTHITDPFRGLGPIGFPLAGHVYEMTHDLNDCSHALAAYLKANARPQDVVLVTYGDSPLQFYTGLKVVGAFQGQELPSDPDWIVVHSTLLDRRPGRDLDVLRFMMQRVDSARYDKVALPCHDFMLGNCGEPKYHLFKDPPEGPQLTLMRKKTG
jgi:hypothetical protein